MAKASATRLQETIETLATLKLTKNAAVQKEVVAAIREWIASSAPDYSELLSGLLSLKDLDDKPDKKKLRDLTRALRLVKLWQAQLETGIAGADALKTIGNIAENKLAEAVDISIGIVHSIKRSTSPAALEEAMSELVQNPLGFLKTNVVTVSGVDAAPAGKKHTYRFWYDLRTGTYKFEAKAAMPLEEFINKEAWIIPVTPFSKVKDTYGELVGAEVSGCQLALTTQFSGCTYCFQVSKDRKTLIAAHIDPEKGKGETGESLSTKLRDRGGFKDGNDGTFQAYGRNKGGFGYGDGLITIIAIKANGGWSIYSQANGMAGKKPVVEQVYPPK